MFVFPTRIAPAELRRPATVESSVGIRSRKTREPAVVRIPFVSKMSFSETGTPCNGPRCTPLMRASSASFASERAWSAGMRIKTPIRSLIAWIRSSVAFVNSRGETCLERTSFAAEESVKDFKSSRVINLYQRVATEPKFLVQCP